MKDKASKKKELLSKIRDKSSIVHAFVRRFLIVNVISVSLFLAVYLVFFSVIRHGTANRVNIVLSLVLFFLFVLAWLTTLFFWIMKTTKQYLQLTQKTIQPMIDSIQQGDFDYRFPEDQQYSEINAIAASYNTLLSEIRDLKISVYEEKLQHQEFENKYLKAQISPHFLINCLNTIFISARIPGNEATTDQIITTLTKHLRYTLSSQTKVPLKEEITYLENYMKLTQLRYPDTLTYEFDIEKGTEEATVFPMILMTLTENSIKTGLIMGEPFLIRVHTYFYEENGTTYLHLTHVDSGEGVTDEMLEKFNSIFEHYEITEKGTGVGLYNVATRLRLLMGENAKIAFFNAPGMGLSVEIDLPYALYETSKQ